jgi:two-component system, cell cycle sensor histidine kinase and response regulator CckA
MVASDDRPCLLVVDDRPDHLYLLTTLLRQAGYRVCEATRAGEAFEVALRERPELVVSDVVLPGVDGIELCRMIRGDGRLRDTPVLLVSALRKDTPSVVEALRVGADDYLEAPYDPPLLVARAERLIERRRAQDELRAAEAAVRELNAELERRVAERTAELRAANAELRREVAERALAEESLRESRRRYELLVNSVNGVVWEAVWPPLRFTFVSRQAERLLGYPAAAWLDDPDFWPSRVHPDDREWAVGYCERAVAERRSHAFEYRMTAADGRTVWVRDIVTVEGGDGGGADLRGIIIDVTEQREASRALREREEQLRQSQKMEAVGQLAGGVAHDFNNLLTAIGGYAELTLRRLAADSPLRRNLTEIARAASRAAALTRQLLAFSRRQIMQPAVLDLNAVILEIKDMLGRLIAEDVRLETRLSPALGRVRADRGQLEQVILNLVVNARDAMPAGGTLLIETSDVRLDDDYARRHAPVEPGEYVRLAVSDTGCGMDAETRKHIFEPFFTTKPAGKGTGLGLSTVYGIVKQSGGYVWAYSEVGEGTVFKIYLPRVEEGAAGPRAAEPPGRDLRGTETILLVEDEEQVRGVAREALEASGYKVIQAAGGAEALSLCESRGGEIDLMITDVVMPGMSGPNVAARLPELRPGVKVLFMSGYTDELIVSRGVLQEGVNFIEKPFSPDDLLHKVREVLDG